MPKANKYRIPELRLRHTPHEFCDVKRHVEGARNDFGEPTITTTAVSSDTKCVIQPIGMLSAQQLKMYDQGLLEVCTEWMMLEGGADIKLSG
jgi:hypothetical protein